MCGCLRKGISVFLLEYGGTAYYKKSEDEDFYNTDILDFFSEVSPCGVIGSFLLDQMGRHKDCFVFKHHYITGAVGSRGSAHWNHIFPQQRGLCYHQFFDCAAAFLAF